MIDALLGPFYADLSALGTILPQERVISHLRTAYETNFLQYSDGKVGPLLIANTKNSQLRPDSGEELQINEVLIGASWVFCSMLFYYDLREEAQRVAETLIKVLYTESGLQFRTPAAWDDNRMFRAPFNLRPLAIWLLGRIREKPETVGAPIRSRAVEG
jgi:non-lysosomal glucosylceramidase